MLLALPADESTPALLEDLSVPALRIEPVGGLLRLVERMAAGAGGVAAVDISLLEQAWFEHLAAWRLQGIVTPVIFILAEQYALEASPDVQLGRYDFLVKPVRAAELLARARLAGSPGDARFADTLHHGDLTLHLVSKEVTLEGRPVDLTAREYVMLRFFMMRQHHVVSQDDLSAYLYGAAQPPGSNTIEAYISRLRRKIGSSRIRTIRGLGYRFG